MDHVCDYRQGGQKCGRHAVYRVYASPDEVSDLRAFFACQAHPQDLYLGLADDGFVVHVPTTI